MICIILKLQNCAFTEKDGHSPKQIGHGPKIGFILYKKNISHFTMIFFFWCEILLCEIHQLTSTQQAWNTIWKNYKLS